MAIQSSAFKVSKPLVLSKAQDDKIFRTILKYKGPLTTIAKQQFLASNPAAQATYTATRSKITSKRNARLTLMKKGGVLKLSEGGGEMGQFAPINPEYQRIQDEIAAANKAGNVTTQDTTTRKGGISVDQAASELKTNFEAKADDPAPADTTTTPTDTTTTSTDTTTTPPDTTSTTTTPPPDTSKDVNAENIQALGQKYLGRDFIQKGLNYYIDPAKNLTLDDIEKMIAGSPEALEYTKKQRGVPDKVTAPEIAAETITTNTNQLAEFTDITGATAVVTPTIATAEQADDPTSKAAKTYTADTTKTDVDTELATLTGKEGTLSTDAQATAEEFTDPKKTDVGTLAAETGTAQTVTDAPTRTLEEGEKVSGSAVDNVEIENTLAKMQAAEILKLSEESSIKGQLGILYQDFNASNPPAWADGAVRTSMATLNARGLGASSLAGQAVVQAVMESALPIAQIDAQASFNLDIQNLNNRQQTVILAAQQRAQFLGQEFDQEFQTRVTNAAKVSEIANLNFSAEQQIAIENAKLAQTVDLANLSNKQALVMAKAAQISNLETANLNNRQQAEIQNAQAFLQMDMANLSNLQQAEMFKAQSIVQALFTDAAAENARLQFNATSQNQVNQFYDSLSTQVKQFNATQSNAMEQFEISQTIAVDQFNVQQQNAVAQFNASNGLVVSQANAQWRQQIATIDTAAQNQINQVNAQNALALTVRDYEGLWQEFRDKMQFAFNSAESILDRETELAKQAMMADATIEASKYGAAGDVGGAVGAVTAAYMNANAKTGSNTNSSGTTQVQPVTIQQPTVSQSQQNVINQNVTIGPGGGSTPGVTS